MDEDQQSSQVQVSYVSQDPETGSLHFDFEAFEEALKALPEDPSQIIPGLENLLRNIPVPEAGARPGKHADVSSDLAIYVRTASSRGGKTRFQRAYGPKTAHFVSLMENAFDITSLDIHAPPLGGKIPRNVKEGSIKYTPQNAGELKNLMLATVASLVLNSYGMPVAYIERPDELGATFTNGSVSLLQTLTGADHHYGNEDSTKQFNQYIEEVLVPLCHGKNLKGSDLLLVVSNLYTRMEGLNTDEGFARFVSLIEPYVRKALPSLLTPTDEKNADAPRDIGQAIALLRKQMSSDDLRGTTPEEAATNVVQLMHDKLGVLQNVGSTFNADARSDVLELATHGPYGLDFTDSSQRVVMLTDGSVIKGMANVPSALEGLLFNVNYAGRVQVILPGNGKGRLDTQKLSERNLTKPVNDGLMTAFYIPPETSAQAGAVQSLLRYLGSADHALFLEQKVLSGEEAAAGKFNLNGGALTIDLAARNITPVQEGGRVICVANHLIYSGDGNADYGVIPWSMGGRRGFLLAQGFNDHNLLASSEARDALSEELSKVMSDLKEGKTGHVDAATGLPLFVGGQTDYDRLERRVRRTDRDSVPYLVVFTPDHFVIPSKEGSGLIPNIKVAEALGLVPQELMHKPTTVKEKAQRDVHNFLAQLGAGVARYVTHVAERGTDLSIFGDTMYSLGHAPHLALIGIVSGEKGKAPMGLHTRLVGDKDHECLSTLLKVPNAEGLYEDRGQTQAYLPRNGSPFTHSMVYFDMSNAISISEAVRLSVQGAENLLRAQAGATGAYLRKNISGTVLSAADAMALQGGRVKIDKKR